jgi:hypothetical protein
MKLNMIVELLQDPPAAKTPSGAERRRSRRHEVTLPGTLSPVENAIAADSLEVQVRNISLHGAGLNCPSPLPIGDAYRLHIGAGPLQLNARLKIISARQRRDETWDIGTEFF